MVAADDDEEEDDDKAYPNVASLKSVVWGKAST